MNQTAIETTMVKYSGPSNIQISEREKDDILHSSRTLSLNISAEEMISIRRGGQDLYFLKNTIWGHQRVIDRHGNDRNFTLVKFSNGTTHPNGRQPGYIILEYLGYYYAKSDHIVTFGNKKYDVSKNDFVIKIGALKKVKD